MNQRIRITRTKTPSTFRTAGQGLAVAVLPMVISGAVRTMLQRRRNRVSTRSAGGTSRVRRVAAESGLISGSSLQWETPMQERPKLNLDRGQIITMLQIAASLRSSSPAAAVALTDIVASQRGQDACHGRNQLTALLQTVYPHAAAVQSAQAGLRESGQSGDNALTSKLSVLEVRYLQFVHGTARMTDGSLDRFARDLLDITEALSSRGDDSREASGRFMLADAYLRLGQVTEANAQLTQALRLKASSDSMDDIEGMSEFGSSIQGRELLSPPEASTNVTGITSELPR